MLSAGGGSASGRGGAHLWWGGLVGGGGSGRGRGSGRGEGGRGHFSPAAIYCITTWCFALKGLRTINLRKHAKEENNSFPRTHKSKEMYSVVKIERAYLEAIFSSLGANTRRRDLISPCKYISSETPCLRNANWDVCDFAFTETNKHGCEINMYLCYFCVCEPPSVNEVKSRE